MNILHIIPRFIGGGPERHLLAFAAQWCAAGHSTRHRVLVLESPVSARLLLRARALGIEMAVRPSIGQVRDAVALADVVEIYYWNHPLLLDTLREELPEMRAVVSAVITGTSAPQVLTRDLGSYADALVIRVDASRGTECVRTAQAAGLSVEIVPALADMTRLDGFVARPHSGIRVGYLGLVEPTKMHPRFADLSAAVTSPHVTFDVFGGGTWAPDLQRQFAERGLAGRIRMHGHVEDLRESLAEIDIFGYPLAPGTYASAEKSIQEAMWVGIPPVVIAGTGAASLVDHECTGLVCESEAEYPAAVDRLASDDAFRRKLGAAARDHARQAFDPVRNAARFRSLFEQVAAMPKRVRPPMPGRDLPGAWKFVSSLGALAGDFAVSLDGEGVHGRDAVRGADERIAAANDVLARGEGGIIHYRNTYPDDAHLRLWSGLVARHRGGPDAGRDDLDAAVAGGLLQWRTEVPAARSSG